MINYLERGQTINGQLYVTELRQLTKIITPKVAVGIHVECSFKLLPYLSIHPRHFSNDNSIDVVEATYDEKY